MPRRGWDQGYSTDAATDPDRDDGRPCARGEWCSDPVSGYGDDGTWQRSPRPGPRPFCDSDRGVILEKLEALPYGWARLDAEAGDLRRSGSSLRMPFGPSLPLHEGMVALCQEMARTLGGWHARVAAIARLTPPDPAAVRSGGKAVARAAEVLCAGTRIDTLLGLEPGWMSRDIPVPSRRDTALPADPVIWPAGRRRAPDWLPDQRVCPPRGSAPVPEDTAAVFADCEIIRAGAGYMVVGVMLSGTDAGLEILGLHRRCELLLGEVRQHRVTLDGVPCRECEDIALELAEPPSDPAQPAMYSACASCGHTMTVEEYRTWSAWYARWADGAGLACRRCQYGRHDECSYDGCQCMACGHAAA